MSLDATLADGDAPESAGVRLADRMAQALIASGAEPGTVIASEDDLMALHGAGRPVLRQAVRILEERGLAFMRRGNRGGLVVAEPNADFAGRALSIVIESLTEDLQPLSLAPLAVDAHLFLHGARRVTLDKCEALLRLARRLDRLPDAEFLRVGAHRQLHKAIRTASGEPALALATRASTEYLMDLIPYSVDVLWEASKGEAWRLMCDTAEALVAGDTARLFEYSRRQAQIVYDSWPAWSAIDRDPRLAPKVGDVDRPEFQLSSSQAERLAREILREIRLMGWKAGERIGGGAELMERYGAGANTLRQAVRMLQEHNAVEVERGRKGGLFIAIPDRDAAVERARAFLRGAGAAAADIEAFLVNLMLGAMDGGRPMPADALRRELGPGPSVAFGALCKAVARASRNPPLELFVDIFAPFLPRDRPPTASAEAAVVFAAGDRARSRRAVILAAGAEASPPAPARR